MCRGIGYLLQNETNILNHGSKHRRGLEAAQSLLGEVTLS
jgi:hypothetical protein